MLDHLERRDDRKAQPFGQKVLGDARAVGNRQVPACRMRASRIDRLAGCVQPEHIEAATGQSFRPQARPAADIQHAKARRGRIFPRDPLGDPADPRRVHPVQRAHRPVGIPPFSRQSVEPSHLVG